jgi:hypothetical protein
MVRDLAGGGAEFFTEFGPEFSEKFRLPSDLLQQAYSRVRR